MTSVARVSATPPSIDTHPETSRKSAAGATICDAEDSPKCDPISVDPAGSADAVNTLWLDVTTQVDGSGLAYPTMMQFVTVAVPAVSALVMPSVGSDPSGQMMVQFSSV